MSDISGDDLKQGGVIQHTVGFLLMDSRAGILICGELDSNRKPSRDFNLIPRGMVRTVKFISSEGVDLA